MAGAEGFEPSALGFGDRCSDQAELRPYAPTESYPTPPVPPRRLPLASKRGRGDMPVLIVGDVHGDIERLFAALKPYPADRWRTFFLGDLVDYGMFGVGCLRFARDRDNTEVLLGNHEAAMLWALRDPARIGFWISVGGQRHDLDELRADEPLQEWLRARPALIRLPDRTLLQHCGNDQYLDLIPVDESDPVEAINGRTRDLLETGGEDLLWNVLSGPNLFATQAARP